MNMQKSAESIVGLLFDKTEGSNVLAVIGLLKFADIRSRKRNGEME